MYIYLSFKSNISKFVLTIWEAFLSNPGPAPHPATPTAPPPYATTPLLSPKLHGVSAPDGSHSAPFAKCNHFLREIYDLDTPNLQNTSVFVLAPNGSHSAPIAKCAHR